MTFIVTDAKTNLTCDVVLTAKPTHLRDLYWAIANAFSRDVLDIHYIMGEHQTVIRDNASLRHLHDRQKLMVVFYPKPKDWTMAEIEDWMITIDCYDYVALFRTEKMNGEKLLELDTNDKLERFGIHNPNRRRRMLQEIFELKRKK